MKDINYSALAKRVRVTLVISQRELAELLGVSCASVNRWENKHFRPTIKTKRKLKELCQKHGIKMED